MKTGVQGIYKLLKILDSGFRRNDGKAHFQTFYETIKVDDFSDEENEHSLLERVAEEVPGNPGGFFYKFEMVPEALPQPARERVSERISSSAVGAKIR